MTRINADLDIHLRYLKHGNGGHGNAVSLPQNNPSNSIRDVTIARLIVGKRHCRILILGNINSHATGFDITARRNFGFW
ncbi:hypothetical protein QUA20_00385 [Microcoleus sp. Pol7_A1]|uniref:hypothetical protein n=1 Tax=Microcoleus sp. Pol7_A1 TaxID=2818893 RepID=UPI002FD09F33